jgi:hypothetical protein
MADSVDPGSRGPWRKLVLVVALLILGLLALALWSERDDALRLPPEEMEGVEETIQGPV